MSCQIVRWERLMVIVEDLRISISLMRVYRQRREIEHTHEAFYSTGLCVTGYER